MVTGADTPASVVAGLPSDEHLLVVLDFDGTLAPIVDHPRDAVLAPGAAEAVAAVADRVPTVVLSGRPVDDLRPRLGRLVDVVDLVGGHGTEVSLRDGGTTSLVDAAAAAAVSTRLGDELRELVDEAEGWVVEVKPTSVAVHHRLVRDEAVREHLLEGVRARLDAVVDEPPGWRRLEGKAVTELRPAGSDKGVALRWLLDRHPGRVPLVLGDDVTDEDAFAVAVEVGGVAVLVADEPRGTAATGRVDGPADVVAVLEGLAGRGA